MPRNRFYVTGTDARNFRFDVSFGSPLGRDERCCAHPTRRPNRSRNALRRCAERMHARSADWSIGTAAPRLHGRWSQTMMLVAGVSRRSRQGGQYTGGASNSGGRRSSVVFPSGNGDLARWAVQRHESNIGVREEPAAVTACSPMRPVVDTARRLWRRCAEAGGRLDCPAQPAQPTVPIRAHPLSRPRPPRRHRSTSGGQSRHT
jgi:hypothetical protein